MLISSILQVQDNHKKEESFWISTYTHQDTSYKTGLNFPFKWRIKAEAKSTIFMTIYRMLKDKTVNIFSFQYKPQHCRTEQIFPTPISPSLSYVILMFTQWIGASISGIFTQAMAGSNTHWGGGSRNEPSTISNKPTS